MAVAIFEARNGQREERDAHDARQIVIDAGSENHVYERSGREGDKDVYRHVSTEPKAK